MTLSRNSHTPAPPVEQAQNPAGLTAKAATHSPDGLACRDVFDARTCVNGNQCASEAFSRPQEVKGLPSIPQAFERMNAEQIEQDEYEDSLGALPPVWLMLLAALVCLFTLFVADTMYSAFFLWMTGGSL